MLQVHSHRRGLARTREALRQGQVTLGFIGGSITSPMPGHNWPEALAGWFVARFPDCRLAVENAAIGATGSELGVLRADAHLVAPDCDVVFIEYAVNDNGLDPERRRRTQEGLIRKLLAGEGRDLVLTYTFSQQMYADMMAERVPPSVRDLEELAEHYALPSVWMGLHALGEVQAGRMRWEEWLPDGLHPQARGSLSYAESVAALLEKELDEAPSEGRIPCGERMPAPLNERNWQGAAHLPLEGIERRGPWTLRRAPDFPYEERVLQTAAPGAGLSVEFEGRGLCLGLNAGKSAADFRCRIDDGPWERRKLQRPEWCAESGWFLALTLADDLPADRHRVEIEVVHGDCPECTGTNFRLALVGCIP